MQPGHGYSFVGPTPAHGRIWPNVSNAARQSRGSFPRDAGAQPPCTVAGVDVAPTRWVLSRVPAGPGGRRSSPGPPPPNSPKAPNCFCAPWLKSAFRTGALCSARHARTSDPTMRSSGTLRDLRDSRHLPTGSVDICARSVEIGTMQPYGVLPPCWRVRFPCWRVRCPCWRACHAT